jgi:radical SAM protein with 4Fe4S-binding SPASM domain
MLNLPNATDQLAVMLKLAGDGCNINCYYCYEKRRPYVQERQWLEPDTLGLFLDKCQGRALRVVLHGGEPLLIGKTRMRSMLGVLRTYTGPLQLAMQTNGLLLDSEWLDLFDELWPETDIAVSLDGPRGANKFRVDYRDNDTYDRTVAGIALLAQRDRAIGIAATVTSLLLDKPHETLDEAASLPGVRALLLSPCLDYRVVTRKFPKGNAQMLRLLNDASRDVAGWATSPFEYSWFVAECFDLWRSKYIGQFLLEPAFSILLRLMGGEPVLTEWSDRKEPYVVVLYPDGSIGSSDEISRPPSLLGSVHGAETLTQILRFEANSILLREMERQVEACRGCSHEQTCSGGSLADRMRLSGTPWEQEYCQSRKWLVDHVKEAVRECQEGTESSLIP